jgi:hypothetical protein
VLGGIYCSYDSYQYDWAGGNSSLSADFPLMGRTIPSFRIALSMEEAEWKPFRNTLDTSDRKKFDEMLFDIPRLYIS